MAVGRFQVMSLLQAARAYLLGLSLESAYSWGLNRAIFIAAAKKGFKGGSQPGRKDGGAKGTSKKESIYTIGDDFAFKTEKGGVLLFTIGGKVQTKEEFEKRVRARFGGAFPAAWKEAVHYVRGFDRDVLLSSGEFFSEVYKPVRDEWAERWTEESDTGP